jgi:hypothetical protein
MASEDVLDRLERATADRRAKNIGFLQVAEHELSALIAVARAARNYRSVVSPRSSLREFEDARIDLIKALEALDAL